VDALVAEGLRVSLTSYLLVFGVLAVLLHSHQAAMEDAASQERLVATGTLAVEGAKGGRVHKLRGLLAAVIVVGLLAASGCNGPQVSKPKVISCSIQPVALMARAIAGDSLKVQVLSGSDAAPLSNARELLLQGAVTFETGMPQMPGVQACREEGHCWSISQACLRTNRQMARGCRSEMLLQWRVTCVIR